MSGKSILVDLLIDFLSFSGSVHSTFSGFARFTFARGTLLLSILEHLVA